MLGLEELLDRRPGALSGGQRQRVAMGRAIVREPAAFLMDEPLSNLDAKLRVDMRAELARLHDRLGITTVYVTHDQIEAMTLGERVAVMRDGTIQQVDTPADALPRPDEPLRRRIHRLAVDEPRRGRARRRPRRRSPASASRWRRTASAGPDVREGDPRHPAAGLRGRADADRRWRRSTSRSRWSRSSAPRRTSSSPSTRRRSTRPRCARRATTASARCCSRPTAARSSPPRSTSRRRRGPGETVTLALDTAASTSSSRRRARRSPTRRSRARRPASPRRRRAAPARPARSTLVSWLESRKEPWTR